MPELCSGSGSVLLPVPPVLCPAGGRSAFGHTAGISLSLHSQELWFINHFSFTTFTLFSLPGASQVPLLFFQAARNVGDLSLPAELCQ